MTAEKMIQILIDEEGYAPESLWVTNGVIHRRNADGTISRLEFRDPDTEVCCWSPTEE